MIKKEDIHKLQPTEAKLVVERVKPLPEVTASGIILTHGQKHLEYKPNSASSDMVVETEIEEDDNTMDCRVISVGPEVTTIKKGDTVLTNKYAGVDMFKDRSFFIIQVRDILAIVK